MLVSTGHPTGLSRSAVLLLGRGRHLHHVDTQAVIKHINMCAPGMVSSDVASHACSIVMIQDCMYEIANTPVNPESLAIRANVEVQTAIEPCMASESHIVCQILLRVHTCTSIWTSKVLVPET